MNHEQDLPVGSRLVQVPAATVVLEGNLTLPPQAKGMVVFAHGSGSSRHSPRNRYVAQVLNEAGLGTLLIDLMTREEEIQEAATRFLRFDIGFLTDRLLAATDWLLDLPEARDLRIGYFGASTGAAAALRAAAERPQAISAVVSRGGRPDLAGHALFRVTASTLLIVGGHDLPVLDMNYEALEKLPGDKQIEIIPGATHLFEESGALEEVARLARQWFLHYLVSPAEDLGTLVQDDLMEELTERPEEEEL
ncbi:MAG: alpha/beta hydrolase [Candidatus Zixiibacteriota bacterium]|nr:MAG: alpha/beta hydrolase [candidate division Zixibacteria bacterium]